MSDEQVHEEGFWGGITLSKIIWTVLSFLVFMLIGMLIFWVVAITIFFVWYLSFVRHY